jgi:hypothetical protein
MIVAAPESRIVLSAGHVRRYSWLLNEQRT